MTKHSPLSHEEIIRYGRHLTLPNVGTAGQNLLKASKVLIVGAGGLGVPVLQYLTAAGVGEIGIVEFDTVDLSNLQRQVIYSTEDVGKHKGDVAVRELQKRNSNVKFTLFREKLTSENALKIFRNYDLIIDCTDNFPARYLINDACVLTGKPFIYGSIYRFEGQISVFNVVDDNVAGPNYRDLFPEPPPPNLVPDCVEGGVLGVLPGIVGSLQAAEAVKLITKIGDPLSGKLLMIDCLTMTFRTINIRTRKNVDEITQLIDYEYFCNPDHDKSNLNEISAKKLKSLIEKKEPFQLIDVREANEYEMANISGKLMPLSNIEAHIGNINRSGTVVIHCQSGKRSEKAIKLLQRDHGFTNLLNLTGGIEMYLKYIEKVG